MNTPQALYSGRSLDKPDKSRHVNTLEV